MHVAPIGLGNLMQTATMLQCQVCYIICRPTCNCNCLYYLSLSSGIIRYGQQYATLEHPNTHNRQKMETYMIGLQLQWPDSTINQNYIYIVCVLSYPKSAGCDSWDNAGATVCTATVAYDDDTVCWFSYARFSNSKWKSLWALIICNPTHSQLITTHFKPWGREN